MEIRHLDLFSGIGGFALGLRQASADFRTIAFCEINPYAQEVLRKNFARTPILHDVSTLNGSEYESDLITAGFPCQDLSIAGKQRGLEGQRSGLFYQTLRIADESQARIILYENSPELIRRDHFREAFVTSLQEREWGVVWRICSAREFGAMHKRERVYALCFRQKAITDPDRFRCVCATAIYHFNTDDYSQKPSKATLSIYRRFCERERVGDYGLDCRDIRGDNGFSTRLEQIHALGNAVLPCIVSAWGEIIKELYPFFSVGSCSTMPSKKG